MQKVDLAAVLLFYGVDTVPGLREQSVRCPVHNEDRPSMSVNLDLGVARCHACGFGGDGISIIMEKEHLDFSTALQRAAERFGVILPVQPGRTRTGLSGEQAPIRGGYKPRIRRGFRAS